MRRRSPGLTTERVTGAALSPRRHDIRSLCTAAIASASQVPGFGRPRTHGESV